jgi:hypothetical protein
VGPASAGKRPVSTRHFCGMTPDAFPANAGPTNPDTTRNCRSRRAGEPVSAADILGSGPPRSPASRLLQNRCQASVLQCCDQRCTANARRTCCIAMGQRTNGTHYLFQPHLWTRPFSLDIRATCLARAAARSPLRANLSTILANNPASNRLRSAIPQSSSIHGTATGCP